MKICSLAGLASPRSAADLLGYTALPYNRIQAFIMFETLTRQNNRLAAVIGRLHHFVKLLRLLLISFSVFLKMNLTTTKTTTKNMSNCVSIFLEFRMATKLTLTRDRE